MSPPISAQTAHLVASRARLHTWHRRYMLETVMILASTGGHWELYFMSAYMEGYYHLLISGG